MGIQGTGDQSQKAYGLSLLDVSLLRNLSFTRDEKELARMTKVDRDVVKSKLSWLMAQGYIGEKFMVTEKGYNAVSTPLSQPVDEVQPPLPPLSMVVLKLVRPGQKDKDLSRQANVDPSTLSAKISELVSQGYLTPNRALTEKGYCVTFQESLNKGVKPGASPMAKEAQAGIQTPTVVMQRDVVKIPCRYCGNLNELALVSNCPRCGAPIP
jgi:hypothetical protein